MRDRGRRATAAVSAPKRPRAPVHLAGGSHRRHTSPGSSAGARPTAQQPARSSSIGYTVAKAVLDRAVSAVGLVFLLPLFAVIALFIKLEDGGPVIYTRERIGLHGKRIIIFKFRTMILNADEFLATHPDLLKTYLSQMKLQHDPRVTRIGYILRRTSMDELPQLINVLRGEMSLVGPRVIHDFEVEGFGALAERRQQVLPGITGLWQVSGRQSLPHAERVRLDEEYLNRRSFWLDLWILVRTIPAVLSCRGAY